jgi:hypothetical protein
MSEETEGVVEERVEQDEPAAMAVEEASAPPVAEAPAAADLEAKVAVAEPAVEEPVAEAPVADPPAETARREAQLYLCERGHRRLILWGEPPMTCNARKTRNEVCGLTLYHSTELPEQVQKALNPIKASKKKSGKK